MPGDKILSTIYNKATTMKTLSVVLVMVLSGCASLADMATYDGPYRHSAGMSARVTTFGSGSSVVTDSHGNKVFETFSRSNNANGR